jgi:acetyl esterase/lipase
MRHRLQEAALLSILILGSGCASALPPAATKPVEPVRQVYREVDGRGLPAYVFAPAASRPAPAILLFHGGGWVSGEAAWTFDAARRFQRLGLVAVAIEYRLAAVPEGAEGPAGQITPIEQLADTCAAFHWVRANAASLGVDATKIAGYGVSAGGHLVAAAATLGCGNREGQLANGGPDAMLVLSPAVDAADDGWFTKLLQGRAGARDYSPVDHVPAHLAPTILMQGTEDNVTPTAAARRFCAEATAKGNRCDLHVYPGVGHLLTRDLKNQEQNSGADPKLRADALAKQEQFLRELWLKPRI